jgi:predicted component of type VI protein secretion system
MGKSDNGGSLTGRTDGLSGLELGMELCAALLSTVGLDGFHGA